MIAYLLKRLLIGIATLLVASLVVFAMLEVVPGDPAQLMLGMNATPDALEALRQQIYTGGMPEERVAISYQMQAIMMDQAPAIFLWKEPDIYALNERVQNFNPTGDERIRLAGMTLAE